MAILWPGGVGGGSAPSGRIVGEAEPEKVKPPPNEALQLTGPDSTNWTGFRDNRSERNAPKRREVRRPSAGAAELGDTGGSCR
ncbi:MAG: hypothetical protein V1790_12910 [Planctomycetota bacterium]